MPAPAGQRARGFPLTAERPEAGRLTERPWFWGLLWLLGIALLFSFPLIKALSATLPPPLPGAEGRPLECELPDETGESRALEELHGRLAIVSAMTLANATEREAALDRLYRLRKHLRGLDKAVAFVVLCSGGDAEVLTPLLDKRKARKPFNLFLLDVHGAEFARLCAEAGSPTAAFLLLDRHGRPRGVYADDEAAQEQLVRETGLLANWAGQDPGPP